MKEELDQLNIKITELAEYLQVSRPTLYKYIEMYESNKRKGISRKVRSLFDYISQTDFLTKSKVIKFILELNSKEKGKREITFKVNKRISSNKQEFINLLLNSEKLDFLIDYLVSYLKNYQTEPLDSSKENKVFLKPLNDFKKSIEKLNIGKVKENEQKSTNKKL